MSDEAIKKLDLLLEQNLKMKQDIEDIKEYIPTRDKVSNEEYRKLRGISPRTLTNYFKKIMILNLPANLNPREDDRHVSIRKMDYVVKVYFTHGNIKAQKLNTK